MELFVGAARSVQDPIRIVDAQLRAVLGVRSRSVHSGAHSGEQDPGKKWSIRMCKYFDFIRFDVTWVPEQEYR